MDEKVVTVDMLTDLSDNIRIVYHFLHPEGLTMEQLSRKAEEHAFYRGILNHVKGAKK